MLAIVLLVIVPTYFLLEIEPWRKITYGGLSGIFLLWLVGTAVTYALHIHIPRPPIRSGYDTGIPEQQTEFANRIGPYIVPTGFLLGATIVLMHASHHRSFVRKTNETKMTACPNCGRILAITSVICPKCESKTNIAG